MAIDDELTATEKGFRLGVLMARGHKFTTAEIAMILGYGSYSGAATLLDRQRLDGIYRDDDGRWRLLSIDSDCSSGTTHTA